MWPETEPWSPGPFANTLPTIYIDKCSFVYIDHVCIYICACMCACDSIYKIFPTRMRDFTYLYQCFYSFFFCLVGFCFLFLPHHHLCHHSWSYFLWSSFILVKNDQHHFLIPFIIIFFSPSSTCLELLHWHMMSRQFFISFHKNQFSSFIGLSGFEDEQDKQTFFFYTG